ncbi:MAG: hypothetical protein AVDCRST_MAG76-3553 [uncultured Acidimicrobiales bacterium]|uniref:Uncharacterized protein n=1 Tax=uncultured Acidimicrobiales bacterium TaxID=310071 RepID=A0A6J4JEU4_9ACTN|nr:MAG: hypothetical protein AVDCRST_MAG76-3553 [uncultured Acidimicrobiales bacterium]
MFLRGPIALGEQILGHVRCSMRPAAASATTAAPTSPTTPFAAQADPTSEDTSGAPVAWFGLAGLGAGAALLFGLRTRRRPRRPEA